MSPSLPILAALALATAPAPPQELEPVPQAAIDAAIERGVAFLLERQDGDGAWRYDDVVMPGATALCLHALLASQVEPQHEAVRRAAARLVRDDPGRTYDVALTLVALAALDPVEYGERLEELTARLVAWQTRDGDWGYPDGGDLSNTQIAALGLRAAARAGVDVPGEVWSQLAGAVLGYRTRKGAFGYGPGTNVGSESMTAAGVATLALCESFLAGAREPLPRPPEAFATAREEGLDWLAERFERALSATRGGWAYYRLYGIERLGAFLGTELLGEQRWYDAGAAAIVRAQREDGGWSHFASLDVAPPGGLFAVQDGDVEVSTAFALLFLRRATSLPATGAELAAQRARRVFGTTSSSAPVQVRATGQDPLTVWVSGWSRDTLERLEWPGERGRGPRVARVELVVDGQVVARVEGDPFAGAGTERFELRHRFPRPGSYELVLRAHVLAPPEGRPQLLESPAFPVDARDVEPLWKRLAAGDRARNLLAAARPRARASSTFEGGQGLPEGVAHPAELAVDNRLLTSWLARGDDREPTLTLTLPTPVRANRILISPARAVPFRAGWFARPVEVEVVVDSRERFRVPMPPDERFKGRLDLPRTRSIQRLEIRILHSVPGARHPSTGLAEVELQLR